MMADKDIYVVGAALINDGKILATKRNNDRILGTLWEFPGGKIENGEMPQEALKREIEEEFNDEIIVGSKITESEHRYDFGTIHLAVYYAKFLTENRDLVAHSKVSWVEPNKLTDLKWADADIKAMQIISQAKIKEVQF
ncbi:hypothetical protein C5L31_000129 [Secundilactobacillus malefermentans]|uniref:8-oxo-dGTP diphosphatase n=2 Tax=Secundilactobacillus malefermentans TaxID=176292 RepID=A0A4V3A461_9LACO|nr:7,8-dihydro-8-oxoguanine-triphosphatase [Secundilactobacillus malefermentans DSM 5705 = KCTC 3548]TDG79333.1 hypothetical protein C5L31_000129 [Secundilactobacillus malefermentans]